jgi:hypothetical protein
MTLDVSQSREDLHDSESDDNIDIHGDVDIDNSSECSDKENVRPVLEEILIPRRNQNTDVDRRLARHGGQSDALIGEGGEASEPLNHLTQPFLRTAIPSPASLGGSDTG